MVKKRQTTTSKPLVYAGFFIAFWTIFLAVINIPQQIDHWLQPAYSGNERTQLVGVWSWIILLVPSVLVWLGTALWVNRSRFSKSTKSRAHTLVDILTTHLPVALGISLLAAFSFYVLAFVLHF